MKCVKIFKELLNLTLIFKGSIHLSLSLSLSLPLQRESASLNIFVGGGRLHVSLLPVVVTS
jgi:hypothetical protein